MGNSLEQQEGTATAVEELVNNMSEIDKTLEGLAFVEKAIKDVDEYIDLKPQMNTINVAIAKLTEFREILRVTLMVKTAGEGGMQMLEEFLDKEE